MSEDDDAPRPVAEILREQGTMPPDHPARPLYAALMAMEANELEHRQLEGSTDPDGPLWKSILAIGVRPGGGAKYYLFPEPLGLEDVRDRDVLLEALLAMPEKPASRDALIAAAGVEHPSETVALFYYGEHEGQRLLGIAWRSAHAYEEAVGFLKLVALLVREKEARARMGSS